MQSRLDAFQSFMQKQDLNEIVPLQPYTFHQTWTIPNMDDNVVPSPKWSQSNVIWRLLCYTKGYKSAVNTHLSVILMAQLNENHTVSFSIKTVGGAKVAKNEDTFTFCKVVRNRGFMNFIPLSELSDYLVDGALTLDLTINYTPQKPSPNSVYRIETGYVGLKNQGCTCYMNSMLEALYHIPAFRRIVFKMPTDPHEQKVSIPLALQHLFTLLQVAELSPSTYELTTSFGFTSYESFMQHDVEEFLRKLIDNLEQKLSKTDKKDDIASLFKGKTVSYVKCIDFDYSSSHFEDFYDISLVVDGNPSLEVALSKSIEDEKLDGDNKYKIDSGEGKGLHEAIKGQKFHVLPPVLHFHLKRFKYVPNFFFGMMKIKSKFSFPSELDMTPYLDDEADHSPDANRYQLFSVLCHKGESMGGHYFAYCRPTADPNWFEFNDDTVKRVTAEEAIEGCYGGESKTYSAYFLTYVRTKEIPTIMAPVDASKLSKHLKDYYDDWRSKRTGEPSSIKVRYITPSDYENTLFDPQHLEDRDLYVICPLAQIKIANITSELKKALENPDTNSVSIWSLQKGLPHTLLNPTTELSKLTSVLTEPLLVAPTQPNDSSANPIPLLVAAFNHHHKEMMRYFGLMTVQKGVKVSDALEQAYQMFNINEFLPKDDNNEGFLIQKDRTFKKLEKDDQITINGILLIQIAKEINPFAGPISPNLFRTIDLLPELRPKDVPGFINYNNNRTFINVYKLNSQDSSEERAFKLEMPSESSFPTLYSSLVAALNLSKDDSLILFTRDQTQKKLGDQPIPASTTDPISKVIIGNTVYFHHLAGVPFSDLQTKVFFKCSVCNEGLHTIAEPILLMPPRFTTKDVISKLNALEIVTTTEIRLVQLSGSRIVSILDQKKQLQDLGPTHIRAEIIPEDQRGDAMKNCTLVRVVLTTDKKTPMNKCFGKPFLFKVIPNEVFTDTKKRLLEISKVDEKEAVFGYTNESSILKDFKLLKDDSKLYDLLQGTNTMIYVFMPSTQHVVLRSNSFDFNAGFKIYN